MYICNMSSIISILFMYSIFYLNIKKKFGLNFQNRGVSKLSIFKQHVCTHTGFQFFLCRL